MHTATGGEPGSSRNEIISHLRHLIGRRLSTTLRAADMRILVFDGASAVEAGGRTGALNLHLQCPWRIDGPDGIVTGRSDLWEPAEQRPDWEPLTDYDKEPNLQDRRLGELMSANGGADGLVVEQVDADDFGGAVLNLSGGYRIAIFPAGSTSEDWRLFGPPWPRHLVVAGGKIERDGSD